VVLGKGRYSSRRLLSRPRWIIKTPVGTPKRYEGKNPTFLLGHSGDIRARHSDSMAERLSHESQGPAQGQAALQFVLLKNNAFLLRRTLSLDSVDNEEETARRSDLSIREL